MRCSLKPAIPFVIASVCCASALANAQDRKLPRPLDTSSPLRHHRSRDAWRTLQQFFRDQRKETCGWQFSYLRWQIARLPLDRRTRDATVRAPLLSEV